MGKTYWMLAISQENFQITRDRGFDVQGIDSKNRRKAVRMAQDDRIIYYIKDRREFTATATVTSGHFRDDKRIWNHFRQKETFPHRVNITPDVVLEGDQRICAYEIGPSLDYVKKWVPEQWELAFFRNASHYSPARLQPARRGNAETTGPVRSGTGCRIAIGNWRSPSTVVAVRNRDSQGP